VDGVRGGVRILPDRREVVENPEAAPLRGGDEITLPDIQVRNRHDRHVQREPPPPCAIVN
jgi:hypothetical protein